MENAVEAIEYAFAVFVFILALSLTFLMFGQLNSLSDARVSDKRIYSDPRTFLALELGADAWDANVNDAYKKREVGLETVVATLYGYYKEQYRVELQNSSGGDLKLSGDARPSSFDDISSLPNSNVNRYHSVWDLTTDIIYGNTPLVQGWWYKPVNQVEEELHKFAKKLIAAYPNPNTKFIETYRYESNVRTIYDDPTDPAGDKIYMYYDTELTKPIIVKRDDTSEIGRYYYDTASGREYIEDIDVFTIVYKLK